MTPHETFFRSPFNSRLPDNLPCLHCHQTMSRHPQHNFLLDLVRCDDCNAKNAHPELRYDFSIDPSDTSGRIHSIYLGCCLDQQTYLIKMYPGNTLICTVDSIDTVDLIVQLVVQLDSNQARFPIDSYSAVLQKLKLYLSFA